jgi:hypothetical protein
MAAEDVTRLELYKLAVEMADRVSARRALANTFFLTANTGVAALLGGTSPRWYLPAAGIALAIAWWGLLQSYRALNRAKFEVINAIEPDLPVQLFTDEWRHLKNRDGSSAGSSPVLKRLAGYRELGTIERIVPLVFIAIYVADLVRLAS